MPTGGALVVKALERSKTRFVFGIPAVHNLPAYDALSGSKLIRNVPVRHEQAAGFMAIGYAYASGEPAACFVGCGPGATNILTPIGEAYLDSAPALVLAGGLRTTSTGRGALHDVDQLSMFRPVTKLCKRLTEASTLDEEVERAIRISSSGRPRPVFLEVPFDVLSSQAAEPPRRGVSVPPPPRVSSETLTSVSRSLTGAERPLIIAGGGVNSSAAWTELAALAERQQIPVACTISAKGAYPENLPLSAGQLWDSVGRTAAAEADIILALGCRFSERSTASWGVGFAGRLIQVDIDPAELGRNYPVSTGVNADVKEFLSLLLAGVQDVGNTARLAWADRISRARAERVGQVEQVEASESSSTIKPQAAVKELAAGLADDAVIVAETGHAFWWPALMLQVRRPRSFLSPAGNSTLGFGFPAALGFKCASPERPVVCLVGDGGFIMTCQEIATSVEEKLPIVTVVFDDGGYAAIREYQRRGYGSRFIGVDFTTRPDFVKLAQSLGADGTVVERAEDLGPALRDACRSSVTRVIDIKIGRDEDVLPRFFTEVYRQR